MTTVIIIPKCDNSNIESAKIELINYFGRRFLVGSSLASVVFSTDLQEEGKFYISENLENVSLIFIETDARTAKEYSKPFFTFKL